MTEAVKTGVFAVGAVVLGCIAYFTQPKPTVVNLPSMVGKMLFPEFEDPSQAASLEIVRYDEELGEIHDFKVAKNGRTGAWTIPSHAGYPADAEDQMRDAALSLVGVKVLGVATQDPAEHEMFGVVEPDKDATNVGDRGVGVLVGFKDEEGNDLAELVIGKSVRDADSQRFVRVPGQDPVYAVEVAPDQLSTKFEDWIEEDLLKLSTFDVEQLTMKDYSLAQTGLGQVTLELRSDAIVNWNSTDSEWEVERILTYRGRESTPAELTENEELNTSKLNDAKNALADLKIVDVRRKPKGLGGNLRADESFTSDPQNRLDLQSKGFYAVPDEGGSFELLSANGEIHVLMKDGYRYLLRFGGVEGTDDESEEGGLNRYLFVNASVDESKFPEPELEDLPADDADSAGAEAEAEDDAAAASTEGEAAEESESDDGDAEDERKRELAAERERITKENQRKLDEWKEKKEKAEKKVNELNSRFADWYYVIAEDVYRKIHLGLSDIISEKELEPDESFDVETFRGLETDGLKASDDSQ